MQTQRALLVTSLHNPLTLTHNRPIPIPGPSQLLLRIHLASLNPHDQKARDHGLFIASSLPAILSNDIVGTVVSVHPSVTHFSPGDRILSYGGLTSDHSQTGLQEYALAEVGSCCKIPGDITDEEAATLPTNVIAAVEGLFGVLRIPAPWMAEGEGFDYAAVMVLIIGGGSNCGKFAVQMAKLAGFGRVVVLGGEEGELKGFGATEVIDRHGGYEEVLGRIREVVGDELVYVFDAVNPPEGQILGVDALSNERMGVMARLLPSGKIDETRIKAGKKMGFEVRDVLGLSGMFKGLTAPFWDLLPGYLETGKIKPLGYTVVEGLDPDTVNGILDRYRDGQKVIKTHVRIV